MRGIYVPLNIDIKCLQLLHVEADLMHKKSKKPDFLAEIHHFKENGALLFMQNLK